MYHPLFLGVLYWSLFWHALLYLLLSSFAIILKGKRELVALLILTFVWSCYFKCPVALSYGVVGWSAVCDCDTS